MLQVRDSEDTRIQPLRMSPTAWSAFTAHASGVAR
ncbi:DUF397 domain-containing protein [Streptomyces longwoodensis]|nr:DUF397 domain-containing protein [Streptomyces longwoodensis]